MQKDKTSLIHSYEEFIGGNYPIGISMIVEKGLIPQTVDDFIGYALLAIESNNRHENDFWFKKHRNFGTIDALAHFENELIILPKSDLLCNIKMDSKLNEYGNLDIAPEDFEKLRTHGVINREEVPTGSLNKEETLNHLILQKLFRNSSLNEYINIRYNNHEELKDSHKISLHLPKYQKTPGVNAWSIGFLDDWTHFSSQSNLTDSDWHIIGVNEINLNQSNAAILSKYGIKTPGELEEIIRYYKENKK